MTLSVRLLRRAMTSTPPSIYDNWSREELISRLKELIDEKRRGQFPVPRLRSTISTKDFDFSKHPVRKIALKFCYSGWDYAGLAFQNMETSQPTVEGVLFDALVKARLIDPEGGFEGCGWEKCGRTDRGVSAAGQVISLWVRSAHNIVDIQSAHEQENQPVMSTLSATRPGSADREEENHSVAGLLGLEFAFDDDDIVHSSSNTTAPDSHRPEHNYVALLNCLLPPTIRILAWSPVAPNFSARFSCIHRHYKYFFSSDLSSGPPLDISRMRAAAARLIGEHDFRNLCKVDPGKQITMFKRTILRANIEPAFLDQNREGMFVLNLVGSAFLYHQVRHIMAVLFMVGSGVEDPEIVSALMNVDGSESSDNNHARNLEVVSCKPEYQMADALPLLLWDCAYPDGLLDWRTNSYRGSNGNENRNDLYQQLHSIDSRSQIVATLNGHFLKAVSQFHKRPCEHSRAPASKEDATILKYSVPLGGGVYRQTFKYVPLLHRNRLDPVEVVNERWRLGKGARRSERKKMADEEECKELSGNE